MASPLFRAKNIGKKNSDGTWLFRNIDIDFSHGVMTITGPSGVGKSTLLKCINQTIVMDEGQVWLDDKTPDQWGVPTWRSKVMYIPQRTTIMEGTPLEFLEEVRAFSVHKRIKDSYDDPVQIALDWGIRPHLWHKKWNTLSGGEMQRISLAIGCSFRPEILLLDEPTSALDEVSCEKVEKTLGHLNCLWVTHNPQQAHRISTAGELVMRGGDNREPPLEVSIDDGNNNNNKNNNSSNNGKKKDGGRGQHEEGEEEESQGKAAGVGAGGRVRQDSASSSDKTVQAGRR
ncbi:P-loop containing nucleoside triphosphate hydrolase protein [Linnemannia elongata]|nr:P-loop containing nucleoside triphosphate hydrolase protein [Linnemannia elongata]